jgi:hypothetical protein
MSDCLREVLWLSRFSSGQNCEGASGENTIADRLLEQRFRERKLRSFRLSQNAVIRSPWILTDLISFRNNVAMERQLLQARNAIRNRYPGCSGCVYNKVGIDS